MCSLLEIDINIRTLDANEINISDRGTANGGTHPGARERLLAAGAKMIAARGLGEVNTNTIAREAGVGVGTFYSCFKDKAALHGEIMALGLARLQEALAQASRQAAAAPLHDQVSATVAAFVDFARDQPALFRVIFAVGEGGLRGGRASVGFSSRAMEQRLGALQQAGELDPGLDAGQAARAARSAASSRSPSRPGQGSLCSTPTRAS